MASSVTVVLRDWDGSRRESDKCPSCFVGGRLAISRDGGGSVVCAECGAETFVDGICVVAVNAGPA